MADPGGRAGTRRGTIATVESDQASAPTASFPTEDRVPAVRRRGARSPRDMALSMAVLLVPIFVLLVVYRVFFAGDAPIAVDAGETYATAKHSAHFTVEVPQDLPPGWTPIAAKFETVTDGSVLRVSYVPPARTGLQLVESDRPVNSLLPDELGTDAQPGNLIDIGGRQWRTYPVAKGGGRALVLAADGYTTVITGTASDADIRTFAASLH
jgi:Protein of unknown function (DUF4245)